MAYIKRVRSETIEYTASLDKSPNRSNANFQRKKPICQHQPVCERGEGCEFFVCLAHCIYKEEGIWYAAASCSGYAVITVNQKRHDTNEQWVKIIQIS